MQNILNIKEKLEEQEKHNFADKKRLLNAEEEKLAIIKAQQEQLELQARQIRKEKLNILELKENTAAREYVDEQVKGQLLKVRIAEKNLESARMRLQRATQERKIHEKLREHAFDDFMKEEGQKEAKEIDQLTSYTHSVKDKEKEQG